MLVSISESDTPDEELAMTTDATRPMTTESPPAATHLILAGDLGKYKGVAGGFDKENRFPTGSRSSTTTWRCALVTGTLVCHAVDRTLASVRPPGQCVANERVPTVVDGPGPQASSSGAC